VSACVAGAFLGCGLSEPAVQHVLQITVTSLQVAIVHTGNHFPVGLACAGLFQAMAAHGCSQEAETSHGAHKLPSEQGGEDGDHHPVLQRGQCRAHDEVAGGFRTWHIVSKMDMYASKRFLRAWHWYQNILSIRGHMS
jgi:hypothetical protein